MANKKQQLIGSHVTAQGGYIGLLNQSLTPFLAQHPKAMFNAYQTPNGFRLIALHAHFLADDDFTKQCFDKLPVDILYQQLCQKQQCFRARVTGKPWRMGIRQKFLGYQDFWQKTSMDKQKINQDWLNHYQTKARQYSACYLLSQAGQGMPAPSVVAFVNLHDTLCKALQKLLLA